MNVIEKNKISISIDIKTNPKASIVVPPLYNG